MHEATGLGGADVFRAGAVGEIEHHQRFEAAAGRACRQDALAIGGGLLGIAHRRYQVGHDDGATEFPGGVGDGLLQGGAVAQVNVPVIGTGKGDPVGHAGFQAAGK